MRRGVLFFAVALVFLAALPARADDLGAAVNAVRSTSLEVNGAVDSFAQTASERIAVGQSLVHSNLSNILGTCSAAGEVMGYGPNIGSIMQGFAGSPSHWKVITQNTWNAMGTGVASDASGRLWVVVVFCKLAVAPPPPPTTAPPTTAPPTTAPPPPPVTTTTSARATTTAAPVVTTPPPVVEPPEPEPVFIRIGPILSIDGTMSLLLGASPFLPASDWQFSDIPSIS